MSDRRVGVWFVGAFGGVGSTAALGLAALSRGLIDDTALVTALPMFRGLDLDRPGTVLNAGPTIARLADIPEAQRPETARSAIERIQADLQSFRETNRLDQVIVVGVASTEPPFELGDLH